MRRFPSSSRIGAFALLAAALAGCGYRPARFADRPAAVTVADDRPIPIPRRTPYLEAFHLSDVFLRRPITDALDAERFPDARDVNALDEVPRSSWFAPIPLEPDAFHRAYAESGPPRPPLRADHDRSSWALVDSRGQSYELVGEPVERPATSSAAELIASRLVRALGYRTPETWLLERSELGLGDGEEPRGDRFVARRWPVGVDLGPTDMTFPRSDDPNDTIPHRDRRTLRALGVLAAWLDLAEIGPERLRDVYVGRPGRGHVQHFLVGLDDAVGAGRVTGAAPERALAVGVVRGHPLTNLLTLGLARPDPRSAGATPTLGAFPARGAARHRLVEPWEPVDRLLAADGYWLAKRISRIPASLLTDIVASAHYPDEAVAHHVEAALLARRRDLIERWYREVTACELDRLSGRELLLDDEAIEQGVELATDSRYEVRILDEGGSEITPARLVSPDQSTIAIALPELERDYLVVQVTAIRAGKPSPRPLEIHLRQTRGVPRVVGVRH